MQKAILGITALIIAGLFTIGVVASRSDSVSASCQPLQIEENPVSAQMLNICEEFNALGYSVIHTFDNSSEYSLSSLFSQSLYVENQNTNLNMAAIAASNTISDTLGIDSVTMQPMQCATDGEAASLIFSEFNNPTRHELKEAQDMRRRNTVDLAISELIVGGLVEGENTCDELLNNGEEYNRFNTEHNGLTALGTVSTRTYSITTNDEKYGEYKIADGSAVIEIILSTPR